MALPKAMSTSNSPEYPTPNVIFDACDAEFGPFVLDPATALGYHTSDVILEREGGRIYTLDGSYERAPDRIGGFYSDPRENDGLRAWWAGRVWLNQPYGRGEWRWIQKAYKSVREGDADLVCALVPVKTGMRWWQKYIEREHDERGIVAEKDHPADVVRYIPGRLTFGDSSTGEMPYSAPFNSAVVVWAKPGVLR